MAQLLVASHGCSCVCKHDGAHHPLGWTHGPSTRTCSFHEPAHALLLMQCFPTIMCSVFSMPVPCNMTWFSQLVSRVKPCRAVTRNCGLNAPFASSAVSNSCKHYIKQLQIQPSQIQHIPIWQHTTALPAENPWPSVPLLAPLNPSHMPFTVPMKPPKA
jgi:hypothetical protein